MRVAVSCQSANRFSNAAISNSVHERISCVFGRLIPSDGSWSISAIRFQCMADQYTKHFENRESSARPIGVWLL